MFFAAHQTTNENEIEEDDEDEEIQKLVSEARPLDLHILHIVRKMNVVIPQNH